MPRRDALYLSDILEAVACIEDFIGGMTHADFMESELVRAAVLQKLTVIGEAAARLTSEFKAEHDEIPWRSAAAFRNVAVHAYFAIDWVIAWEAATIHAPDIAARLAASLDASAGDL